LDQNKTRKLNLEKIIERLLDITEFEDTSRTLLIELGRFDNFVRRINAHLLVYPRDLIDTTLPEGFLMWKMYYFFYLRLNNDSSELESKDKIYKFKLTGMMRILKKYFKYLFD